MLYLPTIATFKYINEKCINPPVINKLKIGEIFLTKCHCSTIGNKLYLVLVNELLILINILKFKKWQQKKP